MMKSPAPVVSTVRNGAMRIDVRKYANGRFGFDWQPTKRERARIRCRGQAAAERKAREMIGVVKAGKLDLMAIDREQFAAFLRWQATQRQSSPVGVVVDAFLASKANKGHSAGHLESLKDLGDFAEAFPGSIDQLDRAEVEKWLNAMGNAPRTFNHKLGRIKALIKFARRDRLVGADLTPVECIEPRKVSHKRECYAPDEIRRMLAVCRETELPFVVLGAFGGMRPEEVRSDPADDKPSIRWENFLWERRKIDVPGIVAKDGRRRFVPILDATLAFLGGFRDRSGECVPKRQPDNVRLWIQKSGVKWIHDGLRHSYASYRLALTQNVAALAEEMGNSVSIIREHYLDLRHEDEAERYFAIRPENLAPLGTKTGKH